MELYGETALKTYAPGEISHQEFFAHGITCLMFISRIVCENPLSVVDSSLDPKLRWRNSAKDWFCPGNEAKISWGMGIHPAWYMPEKEIISFYLICSGAEESLKNNLLSLCVVPKDWWKN